MQVVTTVAEMKQVMRAATAAGKKIGFVPTMGFLHEGHISLVQKSVAENDVTAASIFVNPMQFGPKEDLAAYPRDFDRDCTMLKEAGVDYLFYPAPEEMYPAGFSSQVQVSGVTEGLCGASRPGHFTGVATVVTKLFNIVRPDRAYFGQKDYQQLQVINRFVKDLDMDVEVVGMPIIREDDGLAKSSRNVYLSGEERQSALCLSRSFEVVAKALQEGMYDAETVRGAVKAFISHHPHTKIDYIAFVHPEFLTPLETLDQPFVMALAVYVGRARLIDNHLFEVNS